MRSNLQGRGVGTLVIAIYGVFALSASVRALYQILRKFDEAPLAYLLSLVAAIVYVVATIALAKGQFGLAHKTLMFELVGVLVVGSLSIFIPALFCSSKCLVLLWNGIRIYSISPSTVRFVVDQEG